MCIASAVIIAAIGVAVYLGTAYSTKEVSIASFDNKVTLSLGKHKVDKIRGIGYRYRDITFSTKGNSVAELLDGSDMTVGKISYGSGGGESYLLLYEGYYFIVTVSRRDGISVTIENAYCEVAETPGFVSVPYVASYYQIYFSAEFENNFQKWSKFDFCNDFTSLANLYANINPEYLVGIDLAEKTITLNYCFYDYFAQEIRTDKNLVLKCNDEGVEFLWADSGTDE